MPRGYVPPPTNLPQREDTPLSTVFAGMVRVTHADVSKLSQRGIATAGEFAHAVSDGDLTDNGMTPEESIRLIAEFEKTEYADLLDYFPSSVSSPVDLAIDQEELEDSYPGDSQDQSKRNSLVDAILHITDALHITEFVEEE